MNVHKAVIVAAGWGTRFLPATRSVPKEMLPLLDKPLLHYSVAEAVASGITHIIVVTAEGKEAMAEYFKPNPALEAVLEEKGMNGLLEAVRSIPKMAELSYVCQQEKKGLGHAIGMAKEVVGNEPFAVILPDDIIDSEVPALKQLLGTFTRYKGSVVAVEWVPKNEISAYGVVKPRAVSPSVSQVLDLIEKPKPEDAPSDLGIVGRYVLTPEIFTAIEATPPGSGGEIQITDAIKRLLKQQHVYALEFEGVRQDTGTPIGWLKAQLHYAFKDPEMKRELLEYIFRLSQ